MSFTAESTCDDVIADINLAGKTAVVTGAYGGLGKETCRALASKGAAVVMVGRDIKRLDQAAEDIRRTTDNNAISTQAMNLADLTDVTVAANELLSANPKIDVLINNAGVMACPLMYTVQGLEMQFGVNHVGHFYMTHILLPALLAASNARVVVLSSLAHKWSDVNFDDLNWQHRDYDRMAAYASSKTANSLFAVALNERYCASGLSANAVHPGFIYTELGRHFSPEESAAMTSPDMRLKSIESGAATSVWAATSPELEGVGGLYLEDCQIGQPISDDDALVGYRDYALDKVSANKLWLETQNVIADLNV